MSVELDPDLELVRKLHLELNGSGRRTRGPIPPPMKRMKREPTRHPSEGRKDTPSASRSGGSGSGSGRVVRKEGVLKRLVKKQPDSDSTQHNASPLDDDQTTIANDSLEPQASTKAAAGDAARPDGDVGSTMKPDFLDPEAMKQAAEHAAKLARGAALRDAALGQPRVKCFYQGHAYGLSFHPKVLASRESLAAALKAALAVDNVPVCSPADMEITVLDTEGKQTTCTPRDADSCWRSAVKEAKRVYVTSMALMHAN